MVPVLVSQRGRNNLLRSCLGVISLCTFWLAVAPAHAGVTCAGDCDGSGAVAVNELVLGTNIALDQAEVARCQALDRDANGRISINELVEAVNAALRGCPATPAATHTNTPLRPPTPTPTETSTPTPNPPPQATCRTVYRTFADQPINLTLPASDPGDSLQFAVDALPAGAQLDGGSGQLNWTPGIDQLGPLYLPFRATDSASQTARGEVFFKVTPLDACTMASCDPATGCTADIVPLAEDCCDGPLPDRIPEPKIPCPEGRVVYVGGNVITGFGRLQNCDRLRFDVSGGQAASSLRFRVAARCLNTSSPVTISAQLSTRTQGTVINRISTIILAPRPDGFAYGVSIFPLQAIGFDLEDAEAILRLRLTDVDQATTSNAFRFILTSALLEDKLDVDDSGPTPPPSPCGDLLRATAPPSPASSWTAR